MNLGTLEFGTKINNQAVKDADQIKKQILSKLKDISISVSVKPQSIEDLRKRIEDSLRKGNYNINIQFNNEAIQNLRNLYVIVDFLKGAFEDAAKSARKLAKETSNIKPVAETTNGSIYKLSSSLDGLNVSSKSWQGIAGLFNVYMVKEFLENVIQIGGQLEKQRVSMGAILGDVTKANVLFDQIKSLAIKSPFGVVELDQYTKQLAAYGFEYNELYDMIKRLADISAGAGQDIGRLTLALGHVKSQTYLTGITMRQFSMNNIPMLKMLAEYYSEIEGRVVKVAEVQKRVSQRQVSYEDVIEQFKRLTDYGGMFYNMQEKISDTLAAKWKNLRDALSIMYGELAESSVGDTLKDIATTLTKMTKHWQGILSVLGGVVAVWGTYFVLSKSWLALNVVGNLLKYGTALRTMTALTKAQTIAQAALNNVAKINPYIAVASAIAGVIVLLSSLREKTLSVEEATQKYNDNLEKENALLDEGKRNAEMWAKTLTNVAKSDKDRNLAYSELLSIYPNIFDGISKETAKNMDLLEVLRLINAEYDKKKGQKIDINLNDAKKALNEATVGYDKAVKVYNDYIGDPKNKLRDPYYGTTLANLKKIMEERKDELDIARKNYRTAKEADELEQSRLNRIEDNKVAEWYKKATEAAAKYTELKPKEDSTFKEYKDEIKKSLDDLNNEIEGFDPNTNIADAKAELEILKQKQKVVKYIYKDILGGAEKQSTINKQESAELKAQREELNRLKEEYSEYKKLKKDIGKVSALDKIQELFPNKIDGKTENEFIANYKAALQRIVDVTKDENLKTQITKLIFDVDQDVAKDSADRALALINEEIEKKSGQFNLYKSIFEKTGKRDLAALAFSDGQIWDEQATIFANKLSELVGKTNIDFTMSDYDAQESFKGIKGAYELWKKIVEIVSNNYKDALENAASATAEMLSDTEKIEILENKIVELERANDGIDHSAEIRKYRDEINKLKTDMFEMLPIYQKIFGDMTYKSFKSVSEAENIARQLVKNIKVISKDKNGRANLYSSFYMDGDKKKELELSTQQLERLKKIIDSFHKEKTKKNAAATLAEDIDKLFSEEEGGDEPEEKVRKLGESIAATSKIVGDFAGQLSSMFDALGNDSMAEAMDDVQAGMNSINNIAEGFTKGGVVGGVIAAAGEAVGWIGRIAQKHDKKLDKAIQKSALEVKKLENAYKNLQYEVSKQLTKITKEQSSTMLRSLEQQRAELQKQQELESQKKKKDKDKIIDYQQQVEELGHEIADFYEELASDRYDINIDSWADKISDAITNAFASGEDAAKAFNDTVADIMQDVVSNIVKIGIVKPAMDKLQEYLFGANGIATTSSEEGVEISANEAMGLVAQLSGLKDTIGQAQDIWNVINDAAKQAGVDMAKTGSSSEGTLTKGIQGMSENTADLLASYLNSIRADVASIRLLQEGSGTNPIAQAQLQNLQTLVSLAQERNTRIGEIYDILSRARTDKAFGIYVK